MSDKIDTSPAAIAAPSFTFEAPYDACVRTGLYGQYIALHRAGELIATFSFTEWGGEQGAIQAAWRFAYHVEICTECEALAAERDRLAEENKRLRDALQHLVSLNDSYSPFGGEIYQDRVERTWSIARAALKGDDYA